MKIRNIKYYSLLILLLSVSFFVACSKGEEPVPVDYGYDYYPLKIGNEWVYDVSAIELTTLGEDTTNYQLKEVVEESVDGGDEENFLLYRYKRDDEFDVWVMDSIWSVKKEEKYLVKTENNIRYQKLTFPLSLDLFWDGNVWNTFDENEYSVVGINQAYNVNGESYDEVLEVEHYVEQNLITSVENGEYYGKGIGLIEIYKKSLETQPGEKTLGTIYHQRLKSYKLN